MKNIRLIILILIIFLLGAVCGMVGTGAFLRSRLAHMANEGPPAVRHVIMRTLTRKLDLTAEQQQDISAIISQAQEQLAIVRTAIQPQIETIMSNSASRIQQSLQPEQEAEFERLVQRSRQKWKLLTAGPDVMPRT